MVVAAKSLHIAYEKAPRKKEKPFRNFFPLHIWNMGRLSHVIMHQKAIVLVLIFAAYLLVMVPLL